jgi:hypothetical protein
MSVVVNMQKKILLLHFSSRSQQESTQTEKKDLEKHVYTFDYFSMLNNSFKKC